MQATASLFRSPFDMRPAHLEHHKSTEIEAIGQAKYLTKGQDEIKIKAIPNKMVAVKPEIMFVKYKMAITIAIVMRIPLSKFPMFAFIKIK